MKEVSLIIPTSDGYNLSAVVYEYEGQPKGVVQFNIGTGMRKEFYGNLARYLAEQGFIVCLWEYRGMGKSRPKDKNAFAAITMQDWAKDMSEVLTFLEQRYPDWPKLMVGHSIGGQLLGLMPNHQVLKGVVMLTTSTGTWWRQTFPYKLKAYYFFNVLSPLTAPLVGYLPAKRMKIMEDLPKGLIMEWRSWCNSENYLFDFLGKTIPSSYFNEVCLPIKAYWATDDPIANAHTVPALLKHYRNADIMNEALRPKDYKVKRLGHFGLFSRKFKDTIWKKVAQDLEAMASKNHHYNNPALRKINL